MTIPILEGAKFIGKRSGWRLSNLEMQKIIYIAHMFHLGQQGSPLVYGYFEAWDYGPVHPDLYHYVKSFGAAPINNNLGIFDFFEDLEEGKERQLLDSAVKAFPPNSGPKLVAIAHWRNGAWKKHYAPGERNIIIPNEDILQEYVDRQNAN